MKKLFSSSNIRSLLSWVIKLGTLGFNLPATMGVAATVALLVSGNNKDISPLLLIILQISGVVVVDTVFLASWYDLDTNKSQDDTDKIADAVTVVIMYILTVAIGVMHKEGWAGILFRVPMGIAVARSTWKTISYSIRRGSEGGKAGTPILVRWEQLKAITQKGVEAIRYDLTNYVEELAAQLEVIRAHRQARTDAGKDIVVDMKPIYREQAVASAKTNNVSMTQLPSLTIGNKSVTPTVVPVNSGSPAANTGKTNGNYSIHFDGKEWIATCLHPGCTVVKTGTTELQAKRQIVGHGNAHKNKQTTEEVVDSVPDVVDTSVESNATPVPQTEYVEVPEETHQIADEVSSRFQSSSSGEF